jgi:uncharacterized membrane protein HdeD (DUF308 family)
MNKTCKMVMGVIILLAGITMVGGTTFAGLTTVQLAGVFLILFALGKLAHAFGLCGCCKDGCCEGKGKNCCK